MKRSFEAADWCSLAVLLVSWATMTVIVNPIGNFPLNDDWVYGLAVKSVLADGSFRLPSPASADVFSQAYWGALFCLPFGFSFNALRFSTLILGWVGACMLYQILRERGIQWVYALLAACCMAFNPLYFGLANTFMTDVPFTAAGLIAILLLSRALSRGSRAYSIAGICTAIVALLIRQFGIAILIGYAAARLRKTGISARSLAAAGLPVALGLAAHSLLQSWLRTSGRTPDVINGQAVFPNHDVLLHVAHQLGVSTPAVALHVGLAAAPLLIATLPVGDRSGASRKWRLVKIGLASLIVTTVLLLGGLGLPTGENVLNYFGLGPMTLRDTFLLHTNLPPFRPLVRVLWDCLTYVAVFALASLALRLSKPIEKGSRTVSQADDARVFTTFLGVSLAAYLILAGIITTTFFDRFVLFAIGLALILCGSSLTGAGTCNGRVVVRVFVASIALIAVMAVAIACTHDYLEWNRKRWDALAYLMDAKQVAPSRIDGGYEFNGWYQYDVNYAPTPEKSFWWVKDDQYVVASGGLDGYHKIAEFRFARWLLQVHSHVLVLERNSE